MPLVNFIYEDTSPYFAYSGQWAFVNGSFDRTIQRYTYRLGGLAKALTSSTQLLRKQLHCDQQS
jgi:hypothetical protein